ncbi:hypothetical protein SAY86_020950 [Trapa natans]|uniref:Uncharacterized protein n=1 Tax=Trapa natans TaxID=22666 RepID=A0AAN7RL57_TRANT|nr:hypothetical protein SAY86_020950 [Trapa natans]
MWMDRDVYLGLSSSTRSCLIHSWSFELWQVPHWIHSQPLDPTVSKEEEANALIAASDEKSDRFLKVLAALILGVAGGSLGTFCLLYHWTICGRRRPVAPVEFPGKEKSVDCEYKKVEVAVPLTVNFNILKGKTRLRGLNNESSPKTLFSLFFPPSLAASRLRFSLLGFLLGLLLFHLPLLLGS